MRKLLKSLACFALGAMVGSSALAGYGWYDGAMSIGGQTTDCTAWSTDGNNPTDIGDCTDMTISSVAFNVWSDANDRGGANMGFRIWDGGTTPVGEISQDSFHLGTATRITGDHDFSISWTGTMDLAAAVSLTLEHGKTYYIDMWAKTYGTSGDEWYSGDNGGNYHAKLIYRDPALTKTVTFDGNGEGVVGVPEPLTCYVGDVYKVGGLPSPTRENYRFRGWFTDPDAGTRIRGFTPVEDADPQTLYAHWEHQRQTVTFNVNDGGAGAVPVKATAKYDCGGNYTGSPFTASGATWANHKFLGWYTEPEGGDPVLWGDDVTSDTTRTLYAHWRVYRQTVTFDANDGDAGAVLVATTAKFDQGGTYSGSVFSMTAATWDGYKFLGWFPLQKGGERVKWGDTVTSEDTRTLYAHWRAEAVAAPASRAKAGARSTTTYTDTITADLLAATSTSYADFSGLDKDSAGINSDAVYAGNTSKSSGNIQLNSSTPKGIVTTASGGKAKKVTVVWGNTTVRTLQVYGKASSYTDGSDLFGSDAGTLIGTIVNGTSTELTITDDYAYIGMRSADKALQLTSVEIQWAVEETPTEPSVTVDPTEAKVAVNETVDIYATAEGFSGDVVWSWEGEGDSEDDYFLFAASEAGTYTVTATATCGSESDSASATITVCTPHAINVTVGEHGLAEADAESAIVGTPVQITWFADNGYTLDTITVNNGAVAVADDDSFEMPDAVANVSVTFKEADVFTKITSIGDLTAGEYVITGDGPATGGDAGKIFAMKAVVNTSGSNPFIERQDAAIVLDGTSVIDPDASIVWKLAQVDDGWTIYNASVGYVAYLNAGKNAASAEDPATASSTWTIEESGDSDDLFAVENVNTSGRYLQYNASSPRFAGYTGAQNNLAFYKKPSAAKTQTVTLNLNYDGADNPFDTFVAVAGEPYKVGGIPSPTRDNYRFRGWFTDPTGGDRIRGFTIVPDDPAPTLTLYAHWEHQRQTVTFNVNDGGAGATPASATAKYDCGGNYTGTPFTAAGATWANHKFLGWYTEAEGGDPVIWGDVVTGDTTRTLYAHWRAYRQTVTFDANDGGAGAVLVATTAKFDQGGTYSGSVFSMTAATWDGYKFLGWFPVQKGGTRVKWGDTVTSEDTRTLYAHWRDTAAAALSIRAFSMSAPTAAPAARDAKATATAECTLAFETYAGLAYEVQWTSALDGEWTVLKSWVSDVDGETVVTVEVPAGDTTGFFRLVELED